MRAMAGRKKASRPKTKESETEVVARASADFASVHGRLKAPFASLSVIGTVVAGDGATFSCHASAPFPTGTLDVFEVTFSDGDYRGAAAKPLEPWYLALLRGREPLRWSDAGVIRCDSGTGAIFAGETRDELDSMAEDDESDEMFMHDQVDEVDLPAVVHTPSGAPVAVFSLRDDGTYPVLTGYDAAGEPCAFMIYV